MTDKLEMLLTLLRASGHTVIWHPENEDDSGVAQHWELGCPEDESDDDSLQIEADDDGRTT